MITFPFPPALRDLPSLDGVKPLKYGLGAWSDHVPFAFDLMTALRPAWFVELGTFRGESYFAFCQAAQAAGVETRACAVDTWMGDEQAGSLEENAFHQVDAHNRARYSAFSQLIRGTFDAARPQFADGSIDLLHIDGLHTYEAVRHDFENWCSAVRPGGIVLFHDTAAWHADFGVWRLWQELSRESPGRVFEFRHGYGLGVWRKEGPEPESAFLRSLFAGDERTTAALRDYYERAAADLRTRRQLPPVTATPDPSGEPAVPATRSAVRLQVFFPAPGPYDEVHSYREDLSLAVQFKPGGWRRLAIPLPEDYSGGPLRLDPLDGFGFVDVAGIRLTSRLLNAPALWVCRNKADLDRIRVLGTARRLAHPRLLSFFSVGRDPALVLPEIPLATLGAVGEPLLLEIWLRARVSPEALAGPVCEWLLAHEKQAAEARSDRELAVARIAEDDVRRRADLMAQEVEAARQEAQSTREAHAQAAEKFDVEIRALRAELDAARTERLLTVTELACVREDLARQTDDLASRERARLALVEELAATRVHARNLDAIAENLRRQMEEQQRNGEETETATREAMQREREELQRAWETRQREREAADQFVREAAGRHEREVTDRLEREAETLRAQIARAEAQLATVAGHLAATEESYRNELALRRRMQGSLAWKLGSPVRAVSRLLNGKGVS